MPSSMTGFGAAEGDAGGGRLRVEIRTVNHRFFNFAPRLPGELAHLESEIRERIRRDVERGHVAVQARWSEPPGAAAATVDLSKAQAALARLTALRDGLGLTGDVTLELLARQPDVLSAPSEPLPTLGFAEVEPVVAQAAAECVRMRRREGEALVAELRARLDGLETAAARIAERAPERVGRERDRLRAAIAELAATEHVDEQRLAQEVAYLADKLDITEELVRLRAHVAAAREALAADRAVGKELGFLAQELGREVNTIGSKANDAEIAQRVIGMKGELEKIREQLENLE